MDYTEFCKEYEGFARTLCQVGKEAQAELKMPEEDPLYNAGTMQRDADNPVSSHIVLANAGMFKTALECIENKYADVQDKDEKARLVEDGKARFMFSYLQANGVNLSYEQNGKDVLFKEDGKDVTRSAFYAGMIFNQAMNNTNYFSRHIGDLQVITLEDKGDEMPRKTEECKDFMAHIPAEERQEMFLKRGLYHESMHTALGTDDERKCDVFALLKVMKEHPKYAKEVFEVYNYQRSQIGHTIEQMHKHREDSTRIIKIGAMTYMMPNTYAQLRQYAENPARIPDTDKEILKLTYEMTSKPEFSHEELKEFVGIVTQKPMDKQALSETPIMQACKKQGAEMSKYIAMDKMRTAQRQAGRR